MFAELALCATVLLAADPAGQAAPAPEAEKPQVELVPVEENIIHYTNHHRQRYGLPPLEIDPGLLESARKHATWMTQYRTLQHTRAGVAENIAMGQRNSEEAVRDWMNSSGHRANILNRRHRRIGVAAYQMPGGRIFWCQQFRP